MKVNVQEVLKRALWYTGYIVTVISVCYVCFNIWEHADSLLKQQDIRTLTLCLVVGSTVYAGAYTLLSLAWHYMLHSLDSSARMSNSYFIYARSQIAKYFPGNVFHYAGRQVLGKRSGLGHAQVATASFFETLLSIITALGIALIGIPYLSVPQHTKAALFVAGAAVFGLSVVGIYLFRVLSSVFPVINRHVGTIAKYNRAQWMSFTLVPMLLYSLFFIIVGVVIWIVALSSFSELQTSYMLPFVFTTVYASSWVIGYITPGAPAGLGVRDAIFFAGLSPYLGETRSLSLALVLRLITTIGDVIVYLTSFFVNKRGA
ncbi:MAG: flippase-like domain-containing protein [Deltaproteobacteria bacterium]|nr:flippase-like domain-containing protein [Deltaproteobacteria bacterium]